MPQALHRLSTRCFDIHGTRDTLNTRLSSGSIDLDRALGGGLLPGTLTMIVGATGAGKTQLGLQYCQAGQSQEGTSGAIIDLSSRGDSQNHAGYSSRMFARELTVANLQTERLECPFSNGRPTDVLPFLGYGGRRVLRSQMDVDAWHAWQSELNRRLPLLTRFVYSHLVHGTRRFLIDGIEPQEHAADSLQLELLEFVYHRMLRQEHDWLGREVFRQQFREMSGLVDQHAYDHRASAAMVLVTTKESMLDQLMVRPWSDGDLAAGANTVVLMGRVVENSRLGRGLFVAKHRGSATDDRIHMFDIDDHGIKIRQT